MYDVEINLYGDWVRTVREVFRGSGSPLPDDWSDEQVGLEYYLQTVEDEERAELQRAENEARIRGVQNTLLRNLEEVIVPDIRERTGYKGDRFRFKWVYYQGEHIIEECSSYRIPL
ncbi:hypothetical protein [Paenibacillus beijingensis]|uniref:Uncharacterized protein n=1 Tax=Paenibacillus beijingensis TaxID=1126833 RepID=A0A0D5NP30_9BACL|nr:hypothetical protein [Paenibacillus beijingensis]AJY76920.1 hypothetical protein VN24_23115 [Paenibacillus beijingensis]